MKTALLMASLLISSSVFAGSLSANDDVIACVKKPNRSINPRSWELVMLKKSKGIVVYQNSSRGNESDPITSIGQIGTKLVVQHELGTKETVTFDLANGTATWVEDAYPTNTQVYRTCQSFKTDDFDAIQKWFDSVVDTPEWATRQE